MIGSRNLNILWFAGFSFPALVSIIDLEAHLSVFLAMYIACFIICMMAILLKSISLREKCVYCLGTAFAFALQFVIIAAVGSAISELKDII